MLISACPAYFLGVIVGLGDSLRRAAVDADQSARRLEEEQRLEERNLILAGSLLEKLGRDVADELRARSAPLTLVADRTYRKKFMQTQETTTLVAVDKVWRVGSFAVTQDGHIHEPGFNGVFPLTHTGREDVDSFAAAHGCKTIMGPLRERITPVAREETGEWAVERFYVRDGVLMYGGWPAEDVFAKLIVKMTL